MPVPKDDRRAQISLDTGVYGSLPPEAFPSPEENEDAQIAYWHKNSYGAGQWVHVKLQGGTGISVSYDPDNGTLTISNSDYVVPATFTADAFFAGRILADAVLLGPDIAGSFTADAYMVILQSATFTANAVTLKTVSGAVTADAVLA